ncbi:MAG: NAD(P)/FAD-dependent oxidoreductase [Spirochaetales bacterium]|nr:NAD(P)/FAD-dependent oxidoreductase [Spirochaetales bacterium]
MHDLIVVGGGPAGLTAAVYAVRQRLDVLLITDTLGGKTEMRSEFPGLGDTSGMADASVIRGRELVERFKNELQYLDIARRMERVRRVALAGGREAAARGGAAAQRPTFAVESEGGERLETRAVVVASGCHFEPPRLPGVAEYLLKGIGYSAVSYAHLFLDRVAVVIGSGPRAARAAAQLAHSAKQVYLIGLEGAEGPAGEVREGLVARENVTVLEDHRVLGFQGDQYAREVRVQGPVGSERVIAADGFFLESDAVPNSGMVADLVERDEEGHIRVDSRNRTSAPGIYAAGDVTDVHREQVLVAIGEGAKAALSAQERFFGQSS